MHRCSVSQFSTDRQLMVRWELRRNYRLFDVLREETVEEAFCDCSRRVVYFGEGKPASHRHESDESSRFRFNDITFHDIMLRIPDAYKARPHRQLGKKRERYRDRTKLMAKDARGSTTDRVIDRDRDTEIGRLIEAERDRLEKERNNETGERCRQFN